MQQVGPQRMQQRSGDRSHASQRLSALLAAGDHTADHVSVTADVLGRAVQRHLGPEGARVLQHGSGERVVDKTGTPGACATTAAMSTSSSVGFAGDSMTTIPVSSRIDAATSSAAQ